MPTDSNGMDQIYPSLAGGYTFTMKNSDPESDNHLHLGGNTDRLVDKGGGWWASNDQNKVRVIVNKDPNYENSIGGCGGSFVEDLQRGYSYKSNDMRDVEVKMLIDAVDLPEAFLLQGPTGVHTDPQPCRQGNGYWARWRTGAPMKVQLGREDWHVKYNSLENLGHSMFTGNIEDQIIGVGYVRYNTLHDGKVAVAVEAWVDVNGDGKDWKLWSREVDFLGKGWGTHMDEFGLAKDHPITWGNARVRWKYGEDNDPDVRFKSLSVREIAPFADVTEPGGNTGGGGQSGGGTVPPDPTFGFLPIKFRRHFNLVKGSSCAPVGTATFYEQLTQNGVSELQGTDWEAGEAILTNQSVLFGHAIHEGTVYLSKVGAVVNNSFVVVTKASDGHTTPIILATITPGTIGGTETAINFSSPSNTYLMQVGDRVGVRHSGTSSIYVNVHRHDSVSYDGGNGRRYKKDPTFDDHSGDWKAILKE